MPDAPKSRKRARSIMADDSQWRLIGRRAQAAGMSVSRFVIGRALEPALPAPERDSFSPAMQRAAAVDLRALLLAERLRFERAGAGAAWRRLLEEAEAAVAAEEELE